MKTNFGHRLQLESGPVKVKRDNLFELILSGRVAPPAQDLTFVTDQPHHWRTGTGEFVATNWTVIIASAEASGSEEEACAALARLCRDYWPPLYVFLRRQGRTRHDAQDLTQEFFARLLESRAHGTADRKKGKFRSFLLTMFKNFLANEWNKQQRLKRGGGYQFTSLDEIEVEERDYLGLAVTPAAERLYDQRWARAIIERVMVRLRREYEAAGQLRRFDLGEQWLIGSVGKPDYGAAATELGIDETGMRSIVHRLRRRFRELLRAEVAATVSEPGQVDEEIQSLFEALRG